MGDTGDVRLQLNDLEAEEARIMRELREMDEKAHAEVQANRKRAEQYKEDPEAALTSLLLECEKEVRDAKGYIAEQGPPLRIVRLRHGETGPKSSTYLSRPRNTGVDFTVPVTLKAYTDLIKRPIFLNQIRDKIKHHKYSSTEDYLEDMRLLVRNTAQFNKGPDLAWVVQHSRFLLEAAEEAVTSRRLLFREVEEALRQRTTQKLTRQKDPSLSAVGKRKRSHAQDKTNGDISAIPAVGSAIEIYWPSYRKWYLAYITAHGEGGSCHLRYDEDNSLQWVTLDHERWRMRNSRFTGAARGKRSHEQPTKKRKGTTGAAATADQPVYVTGGVTPEDLDAIKIDLFAKFEDLRDSIMEQLKDHLGRIDRAIIRSDALSRILIQVEDTQANVETAMGSMEKRFESLEKRVKETLNANGPHQGGTRPSPDLEKSRDTHNKNQDPDEADPIERVESEDCVRLDQPGSRPESPGREAEMAKTIDEDKSPGTPPEKGTAGVSVDRDRETGIKVSHSDTVKKTVDGKELADLDREQDMDDTPVKESPKEGKGNDEELASGQEPEAPKGDVEMTDTADEENRRKTDGGVSPKEDKSEVDGQVKTDTKPPGSSRNRRLPDEPIDLEADNKEEAAKDKNEESSGSEQSDDSESEDSEAHKGIAEKKPATRPPPEVESKSPARSPNSEEQQEARSDEENPAGANAEDEMKDDADKVLDEQKEELNVETSKEKPGDENETVAISATGSEGKERGKDHDKEHSSSSREPKAEEDDLGD